MNNLLIFVLRFLLTGCYSLQVHNIREYKIFQGFFIEIIINVLNLVSIAYVVKNFNPITVTSYVIGSATGYVVFSILRKRFSKVI